LLGNELGDNIIASQPKMNRSNVFRFDALTPIGESPKAVVSVSDIQWQQILIHLVEASEPPD